MRSRIVLRSVLAFCVALGMGSMLFPKAPLTARTKPAVHQVVPPAIQVAAAAQAAAPMAPVLSPLAALPSRTVDRDFHLSPVTEPRFKDE